MGDACDPFNLNAILEADGQYKGERPLKLSNEQFTDTPRAYYELHMTNKQGPTPDWFGQAKANVKEGAGIFNAMNYKRPSQWMPAEMYQQIDNEFKTWYANGAKMEDYKAIRKEAKGILDDMDAVIIEDGAQALADNMGIRPQDIQYAQAYFKWLVDAGPLDITNNPAMKSLRKAATTISKAQANMNLMWTFGNVADMVRVYSHYLAKGGPKAIVDGTLNALSKGNPFKRHEDLGKLGLYDSAYLEQQGKNNDPFSWSITAQKNIAHHLDIASGGDGVQGVKEVLFDHSPWDVPAFEQTPSAGLLFGLARYPIYEANWYYETFKKAAAGDQQAATEMATYLLAKSAFIGLASSIPAPVYAALPEDWKEQVKRFEESLPTNLLAKGSNAAIQGLTGQDLSIDLTTYTQPAGGGLGARLSSVANTGKSVVTNATKGVVDVAQGDYDAAALNGLAAVSAFNNFFGVTNDIKYLEYLNSASITKLYGTVAKGLEKDWDSEKWTSGLLKSQFGTSVKDNDTEPKRKGMNLGIGKIDTGL